MAALNGHTIGFIGLGLMGKPMARNLGKAGAALVINNRSQDVIGELSAEGMTPAATPAKAAESADIVITMLPDTPAAEKVMMSAGGVMEGLREGSLIIDMGTTGMLATQSFAAAAREKRAGYVDAPVSGGTIGAEAGALTIMAGGEKSDFDRARPVLQTLGSRVTHVGGVGAGQVAKAANQVIVGLNIGALAEALALAAAAGVDPAKVAEALKGGFADSRILEVHAQRMLNGAFTPGGKCVTQRKDMDQAIELAGHFGMALPATSMSRDLYDKVIEAGNGDLDHSALITAIDTDWEIKAR